MRRRLTILLLVPAFVASTGLAASAESPPTRMRIHASLSCHDGGGADVVLTVRNLWREELRIEGDFHLFLARVREQEREVVSILFVFPAPSHQEIPPDGEVTFQLQMGVGEEGEEGVSLRARRLLLGTEFFFEGRRQAVERKFSYPGCPAP